MSESELLTARFEENRPRLRATAYRMLGSLTDADDAVQEAWIRLNRAGANEIDNLGGWLTTVVARVCLDMLRSRRSRREESLESQNGAAATVRDERPNPEEAAILADSVGLAMLVVLETLSPPERIAFVLHEMFGVSFDEIAPIVERTPAAARQLASRARRRVRGNPPKESADRTKRRQVVEAFLAASRGGDFGALLAVLDPNVVMRPDLAATLSGPSKEVHGATAVAKLFVGRAQAARAALVNGEVGVLVAPEGRLLLVLELSVTAGRISEINVVAAPERLERLNLGVLE